MPTATPDSDRFLSDGERMIIGHRGLSSLAPENTLAAFRSAVDHQVGWVEADVDVIADGTVIICHDSTLDRTTTGRAATTTCPSPTWRESTPEAGSPAGSPESPSPP